MLSILFMLIVQIAAFFMKQKIIFYAFLKVTITCEVMEYQLYHLDKLLVKGRVQVVMFPIFIIHFS